MPPQRQLSASGEMCCSFAEDSCHPFKAEPESSWLYHPAHSDMNRIALGVSRTSRAVPHSAGCRGSSLITSSALPCTWALQQDSTASPQPQQSSVPPRMLGPEETHPSPAPRKVEVMVFSLRREFCKECCRVIPMATGSSITVLLGAWGPQGEVPD